MRMKEYIEKLISQIRCKKARPYIANEIRNHIEDQIAENKTNGMSEEEAEKNAVTDMGDPVEVGISMDKIHKPKMAWSVVVIVGIISILAVIIQWSIIQTSKNCHFELNPNALYTLSLSKFIGSIVAGIFVMSMIYFIDYTVIAKFSQIIGFVMITMAMWALFYGAPINGAQYYVFGSLGFSTASFMMLFVPIYGAILYKYRGGGIGAVLKCIIWLLIPTVIVFRIPNLVGACIVMISMLVQLSMAIAKGWFKVNIKVVLVGLWSVFLLLPMVCLFGMYSLHMLAAYQEARIKALLSFNQKGGYISSVISDYVKNIALWGKSQKDIYGNLPDLNRDYVYAYILNNYGMIAGIIVVVILAALIIFIFGTVMKQKNELGFSMGTGCGMILLMSSVINIFGAIGILPPSSSFLPFFSAGGSNMILSYALIGIVISIYRYKDVYPKDVTDKLTIKRKLDINL